MGTAYSDEKVANRNGKFGTGRQKMALERWTNPKLPRRTCSPLYGLQPCGGKSAQVPKRPRERSPGTPNRYDSQLLHRWMERCRTCAPPPGERFSPSSIATVAKAPSRISSAP
jgi:hypothetical protein